MYKYNKDTLKKELTIEQVFDLVAEMGGDPLPIKGNSFISRTICHNPGCEGSHKLFYYENEGEGGIFHCYTECADSFDIYELVRKRKSIQEGREWQLPKAIEYVAHSFGYSSENFDFEEEEADNLSFFKRYDKLVSNKEDKKIEFKYYDDKILRYMPRPIIADWIDEGITRNVMNKFEICYDPVNHGIVIPHRDENGKLIGIRQRTLVREEEKWGKYRPAKLNGKMYNHPLSLNLYGLYLAKEDIAAAQTAFIVESEKSVLKYMSYFGNCLAVACCGSTITEYQMSLLKKYGAKNIVICFDREGKDDDKNKYVKKFYNFQNKFGAEVNLSFMYDKDGKYLDYKECPLDVGKDIFLKMFEERIIL